MYRRPKFLEELHAIREEMSREADYDMELFAEMARTGERPRHGARRNIRGFITHTPLLDKTIDDANPRDLRSGGKRFHG
ncbi:MAG: hypothetical protein NVSMB56_08410 [Pyrinomonadaceae bacterium]